MYPPDMCDGVRVLESVTIEMRDGVRLAADVYLPIVEPAGSTSCWPVLIERTPYDRRGISRSEYSLADPTPRIRPEVARDMARHGYAVVMQDCRGRYGSEGVFTKYLNEAADGFDTLSWIVDQPWCNGKIGTFGVSYGAHTQLAAACVSPPGLSAMFLDSGGLASAYHSTIRRGGAFELKQATWAFKHARLSPKTEADPERKAALDAVDLTDWFCNMPWSPGNSPLAAAPEYEAYLFEQWRNGTYSDYWRQLGISAIERYGDIPDIPVMILNSWYDPYVWTSITNYLGLREGREETFLTMGPWTHGQRSSSFAGEVEFGPDAVFDKAFGMDYVAYRMAWFDHALKGISSPLFESEVPVTLFEMGGGTGARNDDGRLDHDGRWRAYGSWPVENVEARSLYFTENNTLSRKASDTAPNSLEYIYDPSHPTPTLGGAVTSGEPVMLGGAFDQREREGLIGCAQPGRALKDRPDVLYFETEALSEGVVVCGPVRAELFVSSDCEDTDFVVKLIDVCPPSADDPDGFAMNVCDGILRARYRDSWTDPQLMVPGQIYPITVELLATANRFKAGHRIRIEIASSNYPQFDLNPNTGEPEGAWTKMKIARNRIHFGGMTSSKIVLPMLKKD